MVIYSYVKVPAVNRNVRNRWFPMAQNHPHPGVGPERPHWPSVLQPAEEIGPLDLEILDELLGLCMALLLQDPNFLASGLKIPGLVLWLSGVQVNPQTLLKQSILMVSACSRVDVWTHMLRSSQASSSSLISSSSSSSSERLDSWADHGTGAMRSYAQLLASSKS